MAENENLERQALARVRAAVEQAEAEEAHLHRAEADRKKRQREDRDLETRMRNRAAELARLTRELGTANAQTRKELLSAMASMPLDGEARDSPARDAIMSARRACRNESIEYRTRERRRQRGYRQR